MSTQSFRLRCSVSAVAALALAYVFAPFPASATPPAEILLNTTIRHPAIAPEPGTAATARFSVEIPQAGLLALDLTTVGGGSHPEPMLRLLDLSFPTSGMPWRIDQISTALLVEAPEPGMLLLEVAALEPGGGLPAFKLRSAFQTASTEADDPDAVDPWDDDLGSKKPPTTGVVVAGDGLCMLGEQDDHGDVPLCATPIGSEPSMSGVIHNEAGDDEDLFLVHLPSTAVLQVEAVADADLRLVLRDGNGLAVAALQSESAGAPLRLARALAAGRYFLEVESLNGTDAVYALTLHRSSRP